MEGLARMDRCTVAPAPGGFQVQQPSLPRAEPHRWGLQGTGGPRVSPVPPGSSSLHHPWGTWVSLRLLNAPMLSPLLPLLGGPQIHPGVATAILLGSIGWCRVSNTAW